MVLPIAQKKKNRRDSSTFVLLLISSFASRHCLMGLVFLAGIMVGTTLKKSESIYDTISAHRELLDEGTSNDGWKTMNVFYGSSDHFVSTLPDNQRFFSQARQDEVVLSLLRNKTNGYFVDLASNDATILSNSYALEKNYGWKGLCIEPNPAYWYNLTHARKNCELVGAVVGRNRMDQLHFKFDNLEHGGIVGEDFDNPPRYKHTSSKEYTVTISEIFRKFDVPTIIDYLSLDVEGAEEFIMTDFPFKDYRIRIMTVERPKEKLRKLLESHGYVDILRLSRWGESLWIHECFKEIMDMTQLEKFHGKKQWEEQKARKLEAQNQP